MWAARMTRTWRLALRCCWGVGGPALQPVARQRQRAQPKRPLEQQEKQHKGHKQGCSVMGRSSRRARKDGWTVG
eukprot:11184995-Lingulodinium_polyedra.AAC.1